jgi:hypothetical protein
LDKRLAIYQCNAQRRLGKQASKTGPNHSRAGYDYIELVDLGIIHIRLL